MKIRYPRIALLIVMILVAYAIFTLPFIRESVKYLGNASYLGMFIGGFIFAFSFSSPIAIAVFLLLQPQNMLLASAIGGVGAVIGDIIIFTVIKSFYKKEFRKIEKTKTGQFLEKFLEKSTNPVAREYLLYFVAAIIIILPFPDEIGISLMAGFTNIKIFKLTLISFALHTISIYLLLLIP